MSESGTRKWEKAIIHIDMDAFFASIEIRDNPELEGKPVIIGGDPKSRGVVSTCSYEARRYGVHSAMSCSEAYRRCPQGVFLRGSHERYSIVSKQIHAIFDEFTPLVMPLSCDEAFLDVTGMQRLLGEPEVIAKSIRKRIYDKVKLTASAGVAGTMFVAKIASDMNKPNGLTVIHDDEVLQRLAPLDVGRIWGLGKIGVKRVNAIGIKTIGDLQKWPKKELVGALGNIGGHLFRLCRGIDDREITGEIAKEKSVSNETTFSKDILDFAELKKTLLYLADKVARRCRKYELKGRVVQLKVKYYDFKQVTRRITLSESTDNSQIIYNTVNNMLIEKTDAGMKPVRLLGVGLSSFAESCLESVSQSCLFFEEEEDKLSLIDEKMAQVDKATDIIADKFKNSGLIGRGTLMLDDKE